MLMDDGRLIYSEMPIKRLNIVAVKLNYRDEMFFFSYVIYITPVINERICFSLNIQFIVFDFTRIRCIVHGNIVTDFS